MHIKPYVVLGLATAVAGASLAVVVTATDPYTAEPLMRGLFWGSLFFFVWGLGATIFSVTGIRLPAAISIGFIDAVGMVGYGGLARAGRAPFWLSASIVGATIVLSFVLWRRDRRNQIHA